MRLQELFNLLGLGLPVGLLMIAVLCGQDRKATREKVCQWCLWFGGFSLVFLGTTVLLGFDLAPSKGILGMAFIGLPALVAGAMMFLFDLVFTNSRKNPSAGNHESSDA